MSQTTPEDKVPVFMSQTTLEDKVPVFMSQTTPEDKVPVFMSQAIDFQHIVFRWQHFRSAHRQTGSESDRGE